MVRKIFSGLLAFKYYELFLVQPPLRLLKE